jgi:hypothetical protein
VVEEEHLHGCFSPRGSLCPSLQTEMLVASQSEGTDGALGSVQITPELNELCGNSYVFPPLDSGSFEVVVVASLPPQLPISMGSGGVLAKRSEALLLKSFVACSPV